MSVIAIFRVCAFVKRFTIMDDPLIKLRKTSFANILPFCAPNWLCHLAGRSVKWQCNII